MLPADTFLISSLRHATFLLAVGAGPALADAVEHAEVQLRVDERVDYYPVEGTTLLDISEALGLHLADAGRSAHGLTRAVLVTAYEMEATSRGCRMHSASVHLDLTIELPEWQSSSHIARNDRESWDAALAGLAEHEDGHRRLARDAAHSLATEMYRLPTDLPCRELRKRVERLRLRGSARLQLRSDAYDQATDSGRTQGASLFVQTSPIRARRESGGRYSPLVH